MKINKLLVLAVLSAFGLIANAQTKGPQKNDFNVALTLGYNSSVMGTAVDGTLPSHSIAAKSTNWNDKELSVGFEGGWFFLDEWKLVLGGGMNISKQPGSVAVPGSNDMPNLGGDMMYNNWGDVPTYNAIEDENFVQFNVYTGVDRYFKTKVDGLYVYAGARIGYAYGRNISFTDDENNMGKSIGEAFNIRGALTGGVDYYFTDAFFIGAQVDPFAYTYNSNLIKPQAGLRNMQAKSHNFGILAAPTIKIGFKF